jgi:hypothetical protein
MLQPHHPSKITPRRHHPGSQPNRMTRFSCAKRPIPIKPIHGQDGFISRADSSGFGEGVRPRWLGKVERPWRSGGVFFQSMRQYFLLLPLVFQAPASPTSGLPLPVRPGVFFPPVAGVSTPAKCLHGNGPFHPDPRHRGRPSSCAKPDCRQASKRHSQAKWLYQPANTDSSPPLLVGLVALHLGSALQKDIRPPLDGDPQHRRDPDGGFAGPAGAPRLHRRDRGPELPHRGSDHPALRVRNPSPATPSEPHSSGVLRPPATRLSHRQLHPLFALALTSCEGGEGYAGLNEAGLGGDWPGV